jgi:hypothetical protein
VPEEIKIEVEGETITATKQEIKTNALQTLFLFFVQSIQAIRLFKVELIALRSRFYGLHGDIVLVGLQEAKELVEKLRATEGGSVGLEHESARRLAHLEAQIVSRSLEQMADQSM